jgi:xanthine dehydrogenase accessory factor
MNPRAPAPDLHQVIVEFADQGRLFAVASILQAQGSTPCQAGAKAVVEAGGRIHGTIGGGMVEAEAQRLAVDAIRTGRPVVFDFDLQGDAPGGNGPICGGRVRVLIDPTAKQHRAAYAAAAAAGQRREPGLLLTAIRGGPEPQVTVQFQADPAMPLEPGFPSPDTLRAVRQREQPEFWVAETQAANERLEILVEPLLPKPLLVIVGGGHIGQAVAVQAHLVGFEIVVIDDRPEFATAERFPEDVTVQCGPIGERVGRFPIAADTYLVIATRSHQHDAEALAACLRRKAAYIGMIGSRRKVARLRQDFVASGRATDAEFERVHAPVGLDIGARTVPEIATSIVAELIAVRRRSPCAASRSGALTPDPCNKGSRP